ncbi:thioredoxin domain-containing protein [Candidatus Saccharibacteria bacterium]|nr:thioredoxin domain-containing protein [Candidatus Saccharibacteria bacterium]
MHQRIISITIIIAVVGLIFGLFVYNAINGSSFEGSAWNEQMTLGDKTTAKHHYIMYTDIFCPYCDKFSDAVAAHKDEFMSDYIEGKKIYFEIRVTDMNYLSGHSNNSKPAGEGVYCAAKQEKFWDYYYALLGQIYKDYHSKGIGIDKNSERIPDLKMDYFYDVAKDTDLDYDQFVSCMENHETEEELDKNTQRASNIVGGGVPYFTFDKFVTSGFAGNFDADNDYEQVKLMMEAGL